MCRYVCGCLWVRHFQSTMLPLIKFNVTSRLHSHRARVTQYISWGHVNCFMFVYRFLSFEPTSLRDGVGDVIE